MHSKYEKSAFADQERSTAIQQWMKARVQNIHDKVSSADVLTRHGVTLRKSGDQDEQISCPFHGTDKRPSARYFPQTSTSLSHVWYFVCHSRWDAIGLWKKFNGSKFSEVLFQMERAFGVTPPENTISNSFEDEDPYDPEREEVEHLFDACENRLREDYANFSLDTHLKLGSILDQTRFHYERGAIPVPEVKIRLNRVVQKIGQIIRAEKTNDSNG